jgi:hypothetical protein
MATKKKKPRQTDVFLLSRFPACPENLHPCRVDLLDQTEIYLSGEGQ